jgi:hypothetical protein
MKQVIYTNESGNVKATVRNALKSQVLVRLEGDLENSVMDLIPNARGGFSIPLAENSVNGDIIYAEIEVKINTLSPDTEKTKSKTKKKASVGEAKDIFEYRAQMEREKKERESK